MLDPSGSRRCHHIDSQLSLIFTQERQSYLLLPGGGRVLMKHLNGLQVIGFCFAFLGVIDIFLGLLDIVIIPAFYGGDYNEYPVDFNLENAYGLVILLGVLIIASGAMALRVLITRRYTSVRKFYMSLWFILLLLMIYWVCMIVAISKGSFTLPSSTSKIETSIFIARIFMIVNSLLTLIPLISAFVIYSPVINGCNTCYSGVTILSSPNPSSPSHHYHHHQYPDLIRSERPSTAVDVHTSDLETPLLQT